MRTENWNDVKKILREALQVEASERKAFLDAAAPNGKIRREVESLLSVEPEIDDFMSLPISDFSADFMGSDIFDAEARHSLIGQRIGIYELIGELGCGGMGSVFLARRTDGKFEQKVAVKMLRREVNNERIRRHFRREREIQASLTHPNIARLLDAGTSADGIPFLVMEYIDGTPVDKHCDENRLSLNDRLKLFTKICDAVGTAHRSLIVHRDLKPSNILIDRKGEPKLLDFGISKILHTDGSLDNHTVTVLTAMTPEYASPEQLNGEMVTTSSDIYSLGVVLFKMLTGTHPRTTEQGNKLSLMKLDDHARPILPSEKISRKSSPIRREQLRGDVDNIVGKAISIEPQQRYSSVDQFSADIWRHIDGLPVEARRPTARYRARKFIGRHRILVTASAVVLFSVLTGLGLALWQARETRAQANLAIESQRRSDIEREKAENISQFMLKIISYANPRWYAEGAKYKGETKVVEAMVELSEQIDKEFAGQPAVQSELHHKFAEVYDSYDGAEFGIRARFHARRALELRKQHYGEWHELVAKDMAYIYWTETEDNGEAARTLATAIRMMRATNSKNLNLPFMLESYAWSLGSDKNPALAEMYLRNAPDSLGLNRYELSNQYWEEMLGLLRHHYAEDAFPIVFAKCAAAEVKLKLKKTAEAEAYYHTCRQAENVFENDMRRSMKLQLDYIGPLFETLPKSGDK